MRVALNLDPDELEDLTDTDDLTPLDAHSLYARDALAHRLLSADEERELARRYREEHDPAAYDALVTHNLRLVYALAQHYHATHMDHLDLVQEGTLGLMHAVEKFDERKGFRFTTYAVRWIRQRIGRAIIEQDDAIPWAYNAHEARQRMRRAENALAVQLGHEASEAEARLAAGVTPALAARLATAARVVASLDEPLPGYGQHTGTEQEVTLADLIADDVTDGDEAAERVGDEDARAGLWRVCQAVLTPQQARVIGLRYGIGAGSDLLPERKGTIGGAAHTLEEVGRVIGVTRERVRQVEAAAMKRLRRNLVLDAEGDALRPVVHSRSLRSPASAVPALTVSAVPVDTTRPAPVRADSAPVRPPRGTSAGKSQRAGRAAQTDQKTSESKRAAATSVDRASARIGRAASGASTGKYSTRAQRHTAAAIAQAS